MKKLLSLILAGIMMLSSICVLAEDISSGVFGTEYLEDAKELEFTWEFDEGSYWELYVYNNSNEGLKIEFNKGTRNIYKEEVASKQTASIYGEGKFDKGTYTIKATSLGNENLCGKMYYQITNNAENLQKKIPENITDMNTLPASGGDPKNNVLHVFEQTEPVISIKPVDKLVDVEKVIILEPSPETKAANELSAYGILKGDPDGNMRLGDTITRAEAITLITRMNANYRDISDNYLFRPVFDDTAGHWAEKEIAFAHDNGLVEGTSETTFEPERNVTITEFIKMLVTLLGYKELSEQKGGFPLGYLVTANTLGITGNLNKEATQNALRSDVALMLANSLDVPLMKQNGFGAVIDFVIMDGKDGVPLETFRTMIEAIKKE